MAEACIRCGDCVDACPAGLAPARLYDALRAGGGLADRERLADCTRCGRCDAACPSGIALMATFTAAQQAREAATAEQHVRDAARARYRTRQSRLLRDAADRAAQEAERMQAATSPDAVAAAIARARARRDAAKGKPSP